MGSGTYVLKEDKLTLNNAYLNTEDILKINIIEGNLELKGNIKLFKSTDTESINILYKKAEDETIESILGEIWKSGSLLCLNGYQRDFVMIASKYILDYKRTKDNSLLTPIKEELWFYIYRNGLTYTQKVQGNGIITIYNIPYGVYGLWGLYNRIVDQD